MEFDDQSDTNSEEIVMWPDHKMGLSPFAECGKTTSTVGYRDVSNGTVVASIELPAELIERTVIANVSIEISLSGAGEITSAASGTASDFCSMKRTISLDELVYMLLERPNLHMEETTESELRMLLRKLQKSISAVQRAIAIMKPATS